MTIDFIPADFESGEYGFKKAGRAEFAKIRQWLSAPHLEDWWTPHMEDLSAMESGVEGRAVYVVAHQGFSFAYVQFTDPAYDEELTAAAVYPQGTVQFDQFVGDAQMIGFGHGIKFIKALVAAAKDMPGARKLLVTPAKSNIFAIRTYTQCGFRQERTLERINGEVAVMGQSVG